jgi:membrane protein implicated in regulation of membrane protease activity
MKPFTTIAVIVFSLIALIHLLRLFFGWEVIINGMILPIWISVPGFLIASGLALMLWRESRK